VTDGTVKPKMHSPFPSRARIAVDRAVRRPPFPFRDTRPGAVDRAEARGQGGIFSCTACPEAVVSPGMPELDRDRVWRNCGRRARDGDPAGTDAGPGGRSASAPVASGSGADDATEGCGLLRYRPEPRPGFVRCPRTRDADRGTVTVAPDWQ
jgi:hypothetical protein